MNNREIKEKYFKNNSRIDENEIQRMLNNFVGRYTRKDMRGFRKFMSDDGLNAPSYYEMLEDLRNALRPTPCTDHSRFINFTFDDLKKSMHAFYSKFLPRKVAETDSILNGTNPYFLDKDGNSHVYFHNVKPGDANSSSVGHRGKNDFLEFNMFLHGSLDDLVTTAHELSHAVSAHHKKCVDAIRTGESDQEIEKLAKRPTSLDCTGEIESYIVEGLFVRYLVEKGLATPADVEDYKNQQTQSLISDYGTIMEEREILSQLPDDFDDWHVLELIGKYDADQNNHMLKRITTMATDRKEGPRQFRYVVGRIVADQWLKRYDDADEKTKGDMLDNFQDYLDSTDTLKVDDACEMLLGQNFYSTAEDYINDKVNERKDDAIKTREFFK